MPVQTSVQLFTVNAALEADLDGTLAAIAARGFTAVEPYDFVRRAEPLAASLTAHGLAAPTGHAFLASESFVLPDGSGTTVPVPSPEEVFAAAKTLGMTTVIDPYTAPDRWTSVEQIEHTAGLLNAAAEIGVAHGIRVGYHNHAHELEARFDGVPASSCSRACSIPASSSRSTSTGSPAPASTPPPCCAHWATA